MASWRLIKKQKNAKIAESSICQTSDKRWRAGVDGPWNSSWNLRLPDRSGLMKRYLKNSSGSAPSSLLLFIGWESTWAWRTPWKEIGDDALCDVKPFTETIGMMVSGKRDEGFKCILFRQNLGLKTCPSWCSGTVPGVGFIIKYPIKKCISSYDVQIQF